MSAGDTNIAAAGGPVGVRPKARTARLLRDNRGWLILPAVAAILIISLFPIGYGLLESLQRVPSGFFALRDDPRLWAAMRHTLVLAGVALPAELLLGLALAGIFAGRWPGKALFVSLLALPALVAPVIAGSAWRMLFSNDYGPVNHILSLISGGAVMTLWTEDPSYVYRAILIADIWQWTPFVAVLMLAAVANIDPRQWEMAEVDDAGPWRMLVRIVLPAIWPAIAIAVLIRGVDLLRLFDVVWMLTRGGPEAQTEMLPIFVYNRLMMQDADTSATAALAVVVIMVLSLSFMLLLSLLGRNR